MIVTNVTKKIIKFISIYFSEIRNEIRNYNDAGTFGQVNSNVKADF